MADLKIVRRVVARFKSAGAPQPPLSARQAFLALIKGARGKLRGATSLEEDKKKLADTLETYEKEARKDKDPAVILARKKVQVLGEIVANMRLDLSLSCGEHREPKSSELTKIELAVKTAQRAWGAYLDALGF